MAATLLGTVGVWGIASDETGIIIEKIDDNSRKESNFVKNKSGERQGRADYDESMEIDIAGKITSASPWSQSISSELVMTNTITAGHLAGAGGGQTLIDEVGRTRANEDWTGITIKAEMLPFFPGS